jgi:trk system potassium uptake protein TrkH
LKLFVHSGRSLVFVYFACLIILGSMALSLPYAWDGQESLDFIDILFTATSAVSVTGLITLDTSLFSWLGKLIIMILIQAGGLGVVFLVVLSMLSRNAPIAMHNRSLLGDYFLPGVEQKPRKIMRKILLYALGFELLGAILLWVSFNKQNIEMSWAHALFHAVSAFCNAGFSTFSNSLESFVGQPAVTVVIALLVIAGGLGYMVHDDLRHLLFRSIKILKTHTF